MKNLPKKRHKPKIAFLISGRGSNMMAILKAIKSNNLKVDPVLVFSNVLEAEGLKKAKSHGILTKSFSPKGFDSKLLYEKQLVEQLKSLGAEWIICAGYMCILGETMLASFRNKIINVHPSLLPSFPGLRAQKQAIEYGVRVSGCTFHFVDSGIDTGPILMQIPVAVTLDDTEETLARKILLKEHAHYWQAINMAIHGVEIQGRTTIPIRKEL